MKQPPAVSPDLNAARIGSALSAQLKTWARDREKVERAKDDFATFVECAGTSETGEALSCEDSYTRALASTMDYCRMAGVHLSHVAPPGVGKSTLARLYLLWLIGRDPTTRTVVASGDLGVSEGSVGLCREILLSQAFRSIFPDVKPDFERSGDAVRGFKKDSWYVETGGQSPDPTMVAVAGEPRAENRRVDVLLADDFMTRLTAESSVSRQRLINVFRLTWIDGRLANGGWCLNLQNCWMNTDLAHELRKDARFCSLWVGVTPDCDSLFIRIWHPPAGLPLVENPEAFGAAEVAPHGEADKEYHIALPKNRPSISKKAILERAKNDENSHRQLYRLVASSPADRMFPHWVTKQSIPETVSSMLRLREDGGLPVMNAFDRNRIAIAAGLDLSGMARSGTALWILGMDNSGAIYPIEHDRGRWDPRQMVLRIDDAFTRRGIEFSLLHIENNAVQDLIISSIKAMAQDRQLSWASRIVPWLTGTNKMDPVIGLPALDVEFATEKYVWPLHESTRGEVAHAKTWRVFESAMEECPRFLKKGQTEDSIMAFWFARRGLDRVGMPGQRHTPATGQYDQSGGDPVAENY